MFLSFSLVRNGRPIDASLYIPKMFACTNNECYPNRTTIHFFSRTAIILFLFLSRSLSLSFSYFLFCVKRRITRVIFRRSLFDIGQSISDSFTFEYTLHHYHGCSPSFSIYWCIDCYRCRCFGNYWNLNNLLAFSWSYTFW